jgi:integrase/recombinase XerC
MGYLYRRRGIYWASYWRGGKRVRESCRTSDRKTALAHLSEAQSQGKAAPLAGRAMLTALAGLRVPVPADAKPEAVLLGALVGRANPDELAAAIGERLRAWSERSVDDPQQAGRLAAFRRKMAALITGEQAVKMPLADALTAFAAAPHRRAIRPGTLDDFHRPAWERFRTWAEARGRKHLHEVTEADALAYMGHLAAENLSPASRRNARSVLRAVWNALRVPAGLVGNPWQATPAPDPEASHRRALTVPEIRRLFGAADDPEDRAALALGLFAALRLGDVCRLRWRDVDLAGRMLRVRQGKTGAPVEIPLHPYLVGVLTPLAGSPAAYVVPRLAAGYRVSRGQASARIARVFTRAGLATVEDAEEGAGRRKGHSIGAFHRLRHSFATLAGAAGAPALAVRAITGHRSDSVLALYQHADAELARKAVDSMPTPS